MIPANNFLYRCFLRIGEQKYWQWCRHKIVFFFIWLGGRMDLIKEQFDKNVFDLVDQVPAARIMACVFGGTC